MAQSDVRWLSQAAKIEKGAIPIGCSNCMGAKAKAGELAHQTLREHVSAEKAVDVLKNVLQKHCSAFGAEVALASCVDCDYDGPNITEIMATLSNAALSTRIE